MGKRSLADSRAYSAGGLPLKRWPSKSGGSYDMSLRRQPESYVIWKGWTQLSVRDSSHETWRLWQDSLTCLPLGQLGNACPGLTMSYGAPRPQGATLSSSAFSSTVQKRIQADWTLPSK